MPKLTCRVTLFSTITQASLWSPGEVIISGSKEGREGEGWSGVVEGGVAGPTGMQQATEGVYLEI